jgi:hypothetical protein
VQQGHAQRLAKAATEAERQALLRRGDVVMRSLYRASVGGAQAAAIANWREVSVPQVIRMMQVEKDSLQDLSIEGWASEADQEDPNMELEF